MNSVVCFANGCEPPLRMTPPERTHVRPERLSEDTGRTSIAGGTMFPVLRARFHSRGGVPCRRGESLRRSPSGQHPLNGGLPTSAMLPSSCGGKREFSAEHVPASANPSFECCRRTSYIPPGGLPYPNEQAGAVSTRMVVCNGLFSAARHVFLCTDGGESTVDRAKTTLNKPVIP